MKKSVIMFLGLFFIMTSVGLFSAAAEQDAKGGKDHPLLSRMPDFFIYLYRDNDFDSHKFRDKDGKPDSGRRPPLSYKVRSQQGRSTAREA